MAYNIMVPTFKIKDFYEMDEKEAKEHYEWYMSQIPRRIEVLKIAFESLNNGMVLDFSPDSLKTLWKWFIPLVATKKKSKKEIEDEIKSVPSWLKEYIQQVQMDKLTIETLGIMSDISIYFAEIFVKNHNNLRWDYVTAPKDFYSVNRPIILGFKSNIDLDPRLIIYNLTLKVASGNKNTDALYDLYNIWTRYI